MSIIVMRILQNLGVVSSGDSVVSRHNFTSREWLWSTDVVNGSCIPTAPLCVLPTTLLFNQVIRYNIRSTNHSTSTSYIYTEYLQEPTYRAGRAAAPQGARDYRRPWALSQESLFYFCKVRKTREL